MPIGPKGQKRKAEVIGNAVHTMCIATGEIEDAALDDGKDKAAQAMGRKRRSGARSNAGKLTL